MPDAYGLGELARRAGVSRRTVRYYIQRGLVPAPRGLGRGNHYTDAHLVALARVRELQGQGVLLGDIAEALRGGATSERPSSPGAPATQSTWTRVALGDDVELHVRGRRLHDEQLRKLEASVKKILGDSAR